MFAIAQVLVLVKIILTVVVFDPRSFDTFTLPKSVAAHSTSFVIAALLAWLVARHGRAFLRWSPLHLGAGAVLLAFVLATPFALDQTVALFGVYRRYLGLTQMLDNVLLYLAVAHLFRDLRSLRLLAAVGVGVAVPVLLYALVQRRGLDPFTFVQASTIVPISTLGNPDLVGGLVSIIGISAICFAALLPGTFATWTRLALALVGLACVAVLFATGVRAGVLAIGAGWMAAMTAALRMPSVGRDRRRVLGAVAAILVAGALVSPLRDRLVSAVVADDLAVANRVDNWRVAVEAVRERPLLGVGPDNFAAVYPSRRGTVSLRTGTLENSTHDVWLYVASSAGLVGLAALALFVALGLSRAWQLAGRGHLAALAAVPLAAYLGQALVNVNEIVLEWTFWTSMGVVAGAASAPILARARPTAPRAARAVGALALAAALLAATFGVFPRLVAGEAMLAAEAYSNAGQAATGIEQGQTAVRMDERRAEVWTMYGSALYRAGRFTAATAAFAVAAERQPWSSVPWANLAASWSALGNADAAYGAARRALEADPLDQTARQIVTELGYQRGDYARAAAEGERAIAFGYADEQTYVTTISSYIRLRQLERAEPLSEEAVRRFNTKPVRLQYAAILADRGKRAEALAVLDALERDAPNDPDVQRLRQAIGGR